METTVTDISEINPAWLVLLCSTIVSPVLVVVMQTWAKGKEKDKDAEIDQAKTDAINARLDLVADRAERSASALLSQQQANALKAEQATEEVKRTAEEAARLLKENNIISAESTAKILIGQKQIHTLVNSGLTNTLKGKIKAQRQALEWMRKSDEATRGDVIVLGEIKALEVEISESEMVLSNQEIQTEAVEAQKIEAPGIIQAAKDAVV